MRNFRRALFARAYIPAAIRYPAFRKRRKVGFLAQGGKGNEGPKNQKYEMGSIRGILPSYLPQWVPSDFRLPDVVAFLLPMVSLGVAKFSGGPLCPMALMVAQIFRPQPKPGASQSTKRWVMGEGKRKGENDMGQSANSAAKGGLQGATLPY